MVYLGLLCHRIAATLLKAIKNSLDVYGYYIINRAFVHRRFLLFYSNQGLPPPPPPVTRRHDPTASQLSSRQVCTAENSVQRNRVPFPKPICTYPVKKIDFNTLVRDNV
jgi:hypothetical protein